MSFFSSMNVSNVTKVLKKKTAKSVDMFMPKGKKSSIETVESETQRSSGEEGHRSLSGKDTTTASSALLPFQKHNHDVQDRKPLGKKDLEAALPVYFPEDSVVVVFREHGEVCLSQNYQTQMEDFESIRCSVDGGDRDEAIRQGIVFQGKRFEVFRYHPPLVYGRVAGVPTSESVGIAVIKHSIIHHDCLTEDGEEIDKGTYCYMVVTYTLPETSSRILTQALSYCSKFL